MVDARILHTRAALAEAVLEIAARTPIAKVGVAELARRAGINRATFYDHYSSPGELLAEVLGRELEAVRDQYLRLRREGRGAQEVLRLGLAGTVGHIETRHDIYHRAFVGAPDPDLVGMLTGGLEEACLVVLEETVQPPLPAARARLIARFVAAGLVGGISAWLREPELGRDELVDTLVEAFPRWWR